MPLVPNTPVEIWDPDPKWAEIFAELQTLLTQHLSGLILAVEHIGSTAVPELPAKPIIDLDIVIPSEDQLPEVNRRLTELGYSHQGDKGVPGREAYARANELTPNLGTGKVWMDHHLYVCPQGNPELRRHLAFRDYLRTHPQAVAQYAELKRDLAIRYHDNRLAYTEGKSEFVRQILKIGISPT